MSSSNNTQKQRAPDNHWWRGGVIYQIYPRSYQDSNGDGIGDLAGITQRLQHVVDLGADCIWIAPFFKSPMKDFGYDVSDYCDVDPMFGTLEDFRTLVDRAHALGLKVMIDQVLSHTSDQHPWFEESRANRDNPKADWYVWSDAKADGNPPNNWLSIFGGSGWQWDTRREQYYLHNFLTSQPDLNFHNPAVQDALLNEVRFWLEFGVDGYRLDTSNFYFHDAQLRDNPGQGKAFSALANGPSVNPYNWQSHVYDKSRPENLAFLQRLRALTNEYPNTTLLGEIADDHGLDRVAEYTSGGDKLHQAYSFDLLSPEHSATHLHGLLERFESKVGDGWACWAMSNHDVIRQATRWWGDNPLPAQLQLAAAMQMSLRGSPCIYQGEELGFSEAYVPFEALQDPYGIAMWPEYTGRDGCRTPMVWEPVADAGFSSGKPWLPVSEKQLPLAVSVQRASAQSLLNFYTRLLHWRKNQPALIHGSLTLLPVHPQVLAYVRQHEGQRMLCVFNLSEQPCRWVSPEPLGSAATLSTDSGVSGAQLKDETVELQAWGAAYVVLSASTSTTP